MTTTPRPVGPVLPTAKPLVRRSTLVRKRDEIESGSSPAPAKRAKVAFDEKVEVKNIHDWEKAPEVILEEVRRALQNHSRGEDSGYDELKSMFDSQKEEKKPVSSTTMKSYTMALLSNVSNLNKSCSGLVHAVLNSQWLGRDDDYVRAYMRLMANIVTSQGIFVVELLGMLVENLTGGKRFMRDPKDRYTANCWYRSSI